MFSRDLREIGMFRHGIGEKGRSMMTSMPYLMTLHSALHIQGGGYAPRDQEIPINMTKISFLHIGKTAGTSLKEIIRPNIDAAQKAGFSLTLLQYHGIKLKTVLKEEGTKAVFFVRDPVGRYISGFNSRLRHGRPKYNIKWTPAEEIAFRLFSTPDALASALSSNDKILRAAAHLSMHSIQHVNAPLTKWLTSRRTLKKEQSRIFFIGNQATFDADVEALAAKLEIGNAIPRLSETDRHQSPLGQEDQLSEEAKENLRDWYADDCLIYDWCITNKKKVNKRE